MSLAYVTLFELRSELDLGVDETKDDNLLRRLLQRGTDWINTQQLRRHFDPRRATLRFDDLAGLDGFQFNAWGSVAYSRGILFDDDLCEAVSIVDGVGGVLDPSMYLMHPANKTPYYGVTIRFSANTLWQPDAAGDYERAATVDGVWLWHDRYADAWPSTLDAVADNPLLVGSLTITVSDVDGPAEDSDDPRFQVGNLIRLGSGAAAEFALVRAVTLGTPDTITVQRAVNGTVAAQWPAATPIAVFRPAVKGALIRLATWLYRMKDVTFFERVTMLGSTQKVAQGAIPQDVIDMLPPPPLVIR